jgi:hypothetical protein
MIRIPRRPGQQACLSSQKANPKIVVEIIYLALMETEQLAYQSILDNINTRKSQKSPSSLMKPILF